MPDNELVKHSLHDLFARDAFEACMLLSASTNTRRAYWADAQKWMAFCRANHYDPHEAKPILVAAWVEMMKHENLAPKTRNRRLSALASVYDYLRRNDKVELNPFSADHGPKREAAHALKPTPMAEAELVAKAQNACDADTSYEGIRDSAILRVLWATGARRSSLIEITRERLFVEKSGYRCEVPGKGRGGMGKIVRLWLSGKTAAAVKRLINALEESGIQKGSIFRMSTGRPMQERDVWRAVSRRGDQVAGKLTPHSFRVSFLTLNPASLDARQDAAGHSSPETTRLYDRHWRGKAAFEAMPDVEDVPDQD